jgi:hypothetical protein
VGVLTALGPRHAICSYTKVNSRVQLWVLIETTWLLNVVAMTDPSTQSGVALAAPKISPVLDREGVRARVAVHLAANRPVEELGIERNRPQDCRDFAFVGIAPKRASGNRYRCSFCQTDQKFNAGRIVLSSDGLLRLIGDDCWERHLDRERYSQEAQDYRDYLIWQRFEKLRDRMHPATRDAARHIREVLQKSLVDLRFVESLPALLKRKAPLLFDHLRDAHRADGQLRVERASRDYVALEQGGGGRFTLQLETLHFVSGLNAVLGPVPDLEKTLSEALRQLYTALQTIETTAWDTLSNATAARQITAIERYIRNAVQFAEQVSAAVRSACDFLGAENIFGMSVWCSDHDCELQLENAVLTPAGNGFRFECDGESDFEVKRPPSLTRNLVSDLADLRRLLDAA